MDSRKLSYDDCVKAIGGDEFRSAAEMQYHVNFAIEKGLVALAQQAQPPGKHGHRADCPPAPERCICQDQQAQPEPYFASSPCGAQFKFEPDKQLISQVGVCRHEAKRSGPIAAPQERQHE